MLSEPSVIHFLNSQLVMIKALDTDLIRLIADQSPILTESQSFLIAPGDSIRLGGNFSRKKLPRDTRFHIPAHTRHHFYKTDVKINFPLPTTIKYEKPSIVKFQENPTATALPNALPKTTTLAVKKNYLQIISEDTKSIKFKKENSINYAEDSSIFLDTNSDLEILEYYMSDSKYLTLLFENETVMRQESYITIEADSESNVAKNQTLMFPYGAKFKFLKKTKVNLGEFPTEFGQNEIVAIKALEICTFMDESIIEYIEPTVVAVGSVVKVLAGSEKTFKQGDTLEF